jgi:hypothetical protein
VEIGIMLTIYLLINFYKMYYRLFNEKKSLFSSSIETNIKLKSISCQNCTLLPHGIIIDKQ